MDLLPQQFVLAILAGVVLALFIGWATNKWQLRVLFLLALRLAIGWHFFFEGMHKIHSHAVGPTETNRPFTSEPYFAAAEGPLGDLMRKRYLGDPDAAIAANLKLQYTDKSVAIPDAKTFATYSPSDQAAYCPPAVAAILEKAARDGLPAAEEAVAKAKAEAPKLKSDAKLPEAQAAAAKEVAAAKAAEDAAAKAEAEAEKANARAIVAEDDAKDDKGKAAWQAAKAKAQAAHKTANQARLDAVAARTRATDAEKAAAAAKAKVDDADRKISAAELKVNDLLNDGMGLKARYARWVGGADRREAKAKYVSNDVPQSVPERLAHIEQLESFYESLTARQMAHLGHGYGTELKRTTAAKADVNTAKADLVKDADDFVSDLVKYAGGTPPAPPTKPLEALDTATMWTITLVGAFLMAGFLTRIACVVGAGFLLMTYLSHPTVPWLPLPPMTEGNPLFVNKNIIEMLALLAIAAHPTGRWLGVDALISRFCPCGKNKARE